MEDNHRNKTNYSSFKRKHFARLHARIQNKYDEMQRRLEKSKSVDSLTQIDDNDNYKNKKYASNSDLTNIDEVFHSENRNRCQSLIHTVIVEDVHRNDAVLQVIDNRELSISESESGLFTSDNFDFDIQNNDDNSTHDEHLLYDCFSKGSLESLNEISKTKEQEGTPSPPATPPVSPSKVSKRYKIGHRLRERRIKRQEEKEKKKESWDKVEKFILSNTNKVDPKLWKKNKLATVTIALIEAIGCENEASEDKTRFYSCRFRLGAEKCKSKTIKSTAEVKWQELFNLNLYDEHMLEIYLCDKDAIIGRSLLDLSEIEKEKTHKLRIKLEGEMTSPQIFILLTISGTSLVNTVIDLDDYVENQRKIATAGGKFAWYHLKDDFSEIGWLSLIVYGAKGLSSSDCYCVFQLNNERLQTNTEYKTNDPNWMKIFRFILTDITSVLDVIVHDEKKSEDIAKVSIPLLKIKNGEKTWYALKDTTLRYRAKGNNPRILLEMRVAWNLVKASLRVVNPKEVKYMETEQGFQRHVFARNLSRAKAVSGWILDTFKDVKSCFEWESRRHNIIALAIWLPFCWFFKVWMLPLLLLIPFFIYRPEQYYLVNWKRFHKPVEVEHNEEDFNKNEKEEKTSLRQKINSLQEMIQTVQNGIGKFATLGETIKNLYHFEVPFLSSLAIFFILVIGLVMYIIPTKYIFMCWGIHKFTRKILRPNRIPNNEILDLLSRVPDDETLLDCQELPLEDLSDDDVKI